TGQVGEADALPAVLDFGEVEGAGGCLPERTLVDVGQDGLRAYAVDLGAGDDVVAPVLRQRREGDGEATGDVVDHRAHAHVAHAVELVVASPVAVNAVAAVVQLRGVVDAGGGGGLLVGAGKLIASGDAGVAEALVAYGVVTAEAGGGDLRRPLAEVASGEADLATVGCGVRPPTEERSRASIVGFAAVGCHGGAVIREGFAVHLVEEGHGERRGLERGVLVGANGVGGGVGDDEPAPHQGARFVDGGLPVAVVERGAVRAAGGGEGHGVADGAVRAEGRGAGGGFVDEPPRLAAGELVVDDAGVEGTVR